MPLLLDLFCGAGGAGMGYRRAGFDVVGVDIEKHAYPCGKFVQMDALEFLKIIPCDFDVIHASPPCQRFSVITPEHCKKKHPDYFNDLYAFFDDLQKPYIIENVPGARKKMRMPILLCGSMFGLPIYRHRYFDISPDIGLVPPCNHDFVPVLITGTPRRKGYLRQDASLKKKSDAMGIDWMSTREIDQAIPPVYTEFIGKKLLERL